MPISTYPKLFIVKSILIELLNGFGYNLSRENLFGKVKDLLSILTIDASSFITISKTPTKPFSVSSNGITKPG